MLNWKAIKRYSRQIFALIEKHLFLELRIRGKVVTRFLNPIIQLIVLVFLFRKFFFSNEGNYNIGYWNSTNFLLFLLIAFSINYSKSILFSYKNLFMAEKYWKTLSAVMVAPINRFTLLFGHLVAEFVLNSLPIIIIFIIALILFPIPLFFVFLVLLVFFSIIIVFGAIGLFIGVLSISNEALVHYLAIAMNILIIVSCVSYPKEIFPGIIQSVIKINPFFYLFDLLRLVWYVGMDSQAASGHITLIHIINILVLTILTPIISVYLFNRIYKKYGIVGY